MKNVEIVVHRAVEHASDARETTYEVLETRFICRETGSDEPGHGFNSSEGDGVGGRWQDDAGESELDRTRIAFNCGGITFEVVVARRNRR